MSMVFVDSHWIVAPPHLNRLCYVSLDRALLIDWSDYPGLTDYLVPQSFDWSRLDVLENLVVPPVPRDVGGWRAARELGRSSRWYLSANLSNFFNNSVEILQGHRYDYSHALLRNPALMPRAYALGMDRVRCSVCCTFQYLFKMNSTFQQVMSSLFATIRFPPEPYVAVHLEATVDVVSSIENYISCAIKAAQELHILSPNVVPVSDDQFLIESLMKKHPRIIGSITVAPSRANHTHIGSLPFKAEPATLNAAQRNTFRDFFVMLNSSVLVRGKGYKSLLGNVADAIRHHSSPAGSRVTYVASKGMCRRALVGAKIEWQ